MMAISARPEWSSCIWLCSSEANENTFSMEADKLPGIHSQHLFYLPFPYGAQNSQRKLLVCLLSHSEVRRDHHWYNVSHVSSWWWDGTSRGSGTVWGDMWNGRHYGLNKHVSVWLKISSRTGRPHTETHRPMSFYCSLRHYSQSCFPYIQASVSSFSIRLSAKAVLTGSCT